MWANLAERRLPPGELQQLAHANLNAAARLMSLEKIGIANQRVEEHFLDFKKAQRESR